MKSLKQQFIEIKESTPKHVQWILLGAAFVVVIILLVLLLGHKSNNTSTEDMNENISVTLDPQEIDLTNTEVGSVSSDSIYVTASLPVIIKSIDIDVPAISETDNCDGATDSCMIKVIYKPNSVQSVSETTLKVNWYIESQPEIVKVNEVSVRYSSSKKEEPKKVEPVVVKPIPQPVIEDEEEEPVIEQAAKEIKTVAIENPFREEEQKPSFSLPPEKCSEFAIPGYDPSGRQIGWIKPERGANYFHPFSDKDCSNPTGKYDITTGIITSLKDGSKIGTDSDHIGYRNVRSRNLSIPKLASPRSSVTPTSNGTFGENAVWTKDLKGYREVTGGVIFNDNNDLDPETLLGSGFISGESVTSSRPYDRTFILRQFKPIPATIVSEVRADPSVYGCSGTKCEPAKNYSIPVRATVDRNVYSDDGRTIILPTGTLLMGYLDGNLPGPYQAFGRMNIKWYQFIRPDGVEFNFEDGQDPYSADAQGRMGVPGHGSTDYVEQMVMPILTSLVPAAVNMIAPIADTVINQIDLDNNTIVQSGTIRSSEMAKQEIINTWNKITQKLIVDAIDNTVPPFSIAAGTRINVFSPVDLIVTCDKDANPGKKCAFTTYDSDKRRSWSELKGKVTIDQNDKSWIGQVRSFDLMKYCITDKNGKITIGDKWAESGYDYRTVYMYCESQNYQAINNAKQAAYNESVKTQAAKKYGDVEFNQTSGTFSQSGTEEQIKAYNTEVLGLKYDDNDNIINPWAKQNDPIAEEVLTCEGGISPDSDGCCPGETYTDMGDGSFACCPPGDGDCIEPFDMQ